MESKTNSKEADIIIRFANYIIQQGQYKPEEITILSLYSGQLLTIKNKITKNYPEKDAVIKRVKIRTVDDYQGEENEVVILSMVRSNEHD